MEFDPDNLINKLCAEGMRMEAEGRSEEAHCMFREAWEKAFTDLEKFVAAHYVGRVQKNPLDGLKWHLEALNCALRVMDDRMKGHYPSLYLNIAKSYEDLGDRQRAMENYQHAAHFCAHLPLGGYGDLIRSGISDGLKRIGKPYLSIYLLEQLIDNWCMRRDLKPLSIVLPAYLSNLGTGHDVNKLISALSYLSASHYLDASEQSVISQVIAELARE